MADQLYQAENLPANAIQVVQQEYVEAMATAEGALVEMDYLKSALALYKKSLSERVNTALQESDMMAKYTKPQESSPYQLPGVFAQTQGGYDINQLKKDNEILSSIKQTSSEAKQQNDMYYKMVAGDIKDLNLKLQKLSKNYTDLIAYITQLQQYSKGNIK